MSRFTPVLAAAAADALFGEPPNALHPTVWMGHGLGAARRWHARRPRSAARSLAAGGLAVGISAVAVGMLAAGVDRGRAAAPRVTRDVARGLLLKPALSVRALLAAGHEVETALRRGDLAAARRLLAWHLVSRDTTALSASEVAGAAIESLAENLSDGVVAPLLWYRAGGLAAAYVYRLVNTADAMLGYHTRELEWFGKIAARTDDAMNLVPARFTALLVSLAAPVGGGSSRAALRVALADAGRTPSPNAGWPMAAMAGALGVRLDKRSTPEGGRRRHLYVLHAAGRAPDAHDLARARRVVRAAAGIALGAVAFA